MDEKELEELAAAMVVWLWGDEAEIEGRMEDVMGLVSPEVEPLPLVA